MHLDINNITSEWLGRTGKAEIYLDGVLLKWVVEANEEAGYLVRYKTKSGQFTVVNGEIVKEKLYGKVEIKVKE